ncbi:MAG: hypothetical protein R2758_08415 [Bacteroidales bacterium]
MVLKNITIGKKPMWFVSPDIKHSFTYTPDAGKAPLSLAILLMPTVRYGISRQKTGVTGKQFISMVASEFGLANPKLSILPKWMLFPLDSSSPS